MNINLKISEVKFLKNQKLLKRGKMVSKNLKLMFVALNQKISCIVSNSIFSLIIISIENKHDWGDLERFHTKNLVLNQ